MLKAFGSMYISIDRSIARRGNIVTAVSQACVEELETYYGVKGALTVLNGVDTTLFTPGERKEQRPYILSVGSLITKKGLPDLIKSATYVCRDFPEVKFVLAGTGPLERYLKRLVQKLGLDVHFSFVGRLRLIIASFILSLLGLFTFISVDPWYMRFTLWFPIVFALSFAFLISNLSYRWLRAPLLALALIWW